MKAKALITLAMTVSAALALTSSIVVLAKVSTLTATQTVVPKEIEEQQYIIRFGTTYDWGSTIITEDGNEWTLIDAPEYEDGTEVRVLFDSNRTTKVTDDFIIDVTERRP